MGNNRLHALILIHGHENILDNINLLMLQIILLIEKTAASKHSDIFLRIIHNICKIMLTLRCFLYIYISYQIFIACRTYYHSLNRFPQATDNCIGNSWKKDLIYKFIQGPHAFILNWTFLSFPDFSWENRCKKKVCRNYYDEWKINIY